jgi:hypothetical protein
VVHCSRCSLCSPSPLSALLSALDSPATSTMAALASPSKGQQAFTQEQIDEYAVHFKSFDANADNFIDDKSVESSAAAEKI